MLYKTDDNKIQIDISLVKNPIAEGNPFELVFKPRKGIDPTGTITVSSTPEGIHETIDFEREIKSKSLKSAPTTRLSYGPHLLQFSFSSGGTKDPDLSPDGDPLILRFYKESSVKLVQPSKAEDIPNEALWNLIKQKTIDFNSYVDIIDEVMACHIPKVNDESLFNDDEEKKKLKNRLPFFGASSYSLLKFSTELLLKKMCGFSDKELQDEYFVGESGNKMLPYIQLILSRLKEYDIKKNRDCFDENEILFSRVNRCLIELIWSYWNEEGMLVQTMNAISLRFQNIRNGTGDPLARLDVDPLRPLNNILWGYIQDTQHRLSIPRRVYEYDHHYGLRLVGNAVPPINSVDSRSKFIEGFHNLLSKCSLYYKDVDDMTRRADGFPVLNSLKEVHLQLAEGAHNQFGDLPTTARAEMLIEQWILSRPEVRDFLGGKAMVPYTETWMDRVDSMKAIQGWTDTSVSYFSELARYGEQILLSIRNDNWSKINDSLTAGNWAIFWRNEIQQYIHSYFAVTGVDLSAESFGNPQEKFIQPSVLIQRKMEGLLPGRTRRFVTPNY